MKNFIVTLLLLSIPLTYANEVEEDQAVVLDEGDDISQELLAMIEDGRISVDDIAGEDFIINMPNDDVQDRSWEKCFRIKKSFKIVFKKFRFSVSGCVKVIWLSHEMGVGIVLTIGRLKIRKTISLRNPPSLCYGIPGFKLAKVCLQLYDINPGRRSGCVKLNFRFLRWRWDMRVGCFRFYHVMADADSSISGYERFTKNGDKTMEVEVLEENIQ